VDVAVDHVARHRRKSERERLRKNEREREREKKREIEREKETKESKYTADIFNKAQI